MKRIIIAIVAALTLAGCEPPSGYSVSDTRALTNALPPGATNVNLLGNGWVKFDFEGNHFLFRRTFQDRSASDCITQIK